MTTERIMCFHHSEADKGPNGQTLKHKRFQLKRGRWHTGGGDGCLGWWRPFSLLTEAACPPNFSHCILLWPQQRWKTTGPSFYLPFKMDWHSSVWEGMAWFFQKCKCSCHFIDSKVKGSWVGRSDNMMRSETCVPEKFAVELCLSCKISLKNSV